MGLAPRTRGFLWRAIATAGAVKLSWEFVTLSGAESRLLSFLWGRALSTPPLGPARLFMPSAYFLKQVWYASTMVPFLCVNPFACKACEFRSCAMFNVACHVFCMQVRVHILVPVCLLQCRVGNSYRCVNVRHSEEWMGIR